MFLFGDNIVNDYNFKSLFNHLVSLRAIRGRDYLYFNKEQITLNPSPIILNSNLCYKYQVLSINKFHPYIGRNIDHKKKIITDYVFDSMERHTFDKTSGPYTLGWTHDFNYTSVIDSIMNLVETIPKEKRSDALFVVSYICSRIDSCNDNINGIIEGRWKSTFTEGRHPSHWKNLGDIFRERIKLRRPVKYGQCWVLADILTGILGFLGLKSRTIEIKNCIMDLYLTGGFDYTSSTKDFILKSSQYEEILDPRKDHLGEFKYSLEINLDDKELLITKGPIFDLNNEVLINPKDFYDLNYFTENKENKSWNFHVWTEVRIKDQWYILDPSPLHDIESDFKPYLEDRGHVFLKNKKYFGPINIYNIQTNQEPLTLKYNFRYLYSCINGQIRAWCPLIQEQKIILYLNKVIYDKPQIYQRNLLGKSICVSNRYRINNINYDNIHKHNPVYFMIKNNNLTQLYLFIREKKASLYVIQISFFHGNTPLYIHRESMREITQERLIFLKHDILKKYRSYADRFTVSIYDVYTDDFWTQCIQI